MMLSFVRGLNNPVCKSRYIQDYYEYSRKRCEENDIFLFDQIDFYYNKMTDEKRGVMASIKDCLIALRDIERIICYDLKKTNENEHLMLVSHSQYLLKEDQHPYLNFVRKLQMNEHDNDKIKEIKKEMIIKVYMDIKINTSVVLFSLKQFK